MHTARLQIVLVLAAVWIAALCLIHPLLGFISAVLLVIVETAGAKDWIDPATLATAASIGWALFVLGLSRVTSPGATLLFGSSGTVLYGLYLVLSPQRKEGTNP